MICCSITAPTKEEIIYDIQEARKFADIVELRLDYIKNLNLGFVTEIIQRAPRPVIATCRKREEGGKFLGSENERVEILKKCIENGAEYIDVELSVGERIINELNLIKGSTKLIISVHDFKSKPNLNRIYEELRNAKADIIKVSFMANSIKDNIQLFDLMARSKKDGIKIIGVCMGEKGEISRLMGPRYGSYMTYGSLGRGQKSAPGQISCDYLKNIYRVDKIDSTWKIYGLIGNPVCASKGFILHNFNFQAKKINAVYINFLIDDLADFFKTFKKMINGASVTMPFKEEVIKYTDRNDKIAEKIGAVNTIIKKSRELIGYNTDYYGALTAIEEKVCIRGKNVLMIGAGGAAKAIGLIILEKKGTLILTNRNINKGKKLAKELGCKFQSIIDIDWHKIDILVNATSVGMYPEIDKMIIDEKYLDKRMIVFDAVYNPIKTRLLKAAELKGCTIISGINMYIYQAEKQFELWTGQKFEKTAVEKSLLELEK